MNFKVICMFGALCNVIDEEDLNLLTLIKVTKHKIAMEWQDTKIEYSYADDIEIVKVEPEIVEIMPCLRMNPFSGISIFKIGYDQLTLFLDYCSIAESYTTIRDISDAIKNTFNDGGELIIEMLNPIV